MNTVINHCQLHGLPFGSPIGIVFSNPFGRSLAESEGPSSLVISSAAGFAFPLSVIPENISFRKLVTSFAMRFSGIVPNWASSGMKMQSWGQGLKMAGIAAWGIFANMMNLVAIWNWANEFFVHNPVTPTVFPVKTNQPISKGVSRTVVFPASGVFNNIESANQSGQYGKWFHVDTVLHDCNIAIV